MHYTSLLYIYLSIHLLYIIAELEKEREIWSQANVVFHLVLHTWLMSNTKSTYEKKSFIVYNSGELRQYHVKQPFV